MPVPSAGCRCSAPEDELSEHRDGCSSRERRRRTSPKPQPSPAACALPASFAAAAARQNIDRRIRRRRRNGEAEHARKLAITHITSLLCRSSSLRISPNRTEGAGSIDPIKNCPPKLLSPAIGFNATSVGRATSPAAGGWMCGWARNYVASYLLVIFSHF